MASSRNKTSGLRILWIPGKRKSHPKGRYDSTNKSVSYSNAQPKKNEVWSLGGAKAHKNLLEADADSPLFEGPSSSSSILTPLTCTVAAGTIASAKCDPAEDSAAKKSTTPATTEPTTPNSGTSTPSTALATSAPVSPVPTTSPTTAALSPVTGTDTTTTPAAQSDTSEMPSAKHAVAVATTTTRAEIFEENRFGILAKMNGGTAAIDNLYLHDLPSPPKHDPNSPSDGVLNTSFETTTATTPSTSPQSDTKSNGQHSPTKKKSKRNHNNNHQESPTPPRSKSKERDHRAKHKKSKNKSHESNGRPESPMPTGSGVKNRSSEDVDSIQSLNDKTNGDLEWIDELGAEYTSKMQTLEKQSPESRLKKKRQLANAKDLDQLDGVTAHKVNYKNHLQERDHKMLQKDKEKMREEEQKEEKLVTCLYYAMMCCECTIS